MCWARCACSRRRAQSTPVSSSPRVEVRSTGSASGLRARTTSQSLFHPTPARNSRGEAYLGTWNRLHGTSHVTCRLGNVYGPRQLPTLEGGVIAIFLDRLRDGRETEIFGDGNQSRDFVYVGDVVGALIAAAASPASGIFNVGSGIATTVLELHRLCAEAAGVEQEPRFADARPGDLQHSVIDPSRAASELGWHAEMTLARGLAVTWSAVRSEAS
jgi:UDP-glucose 4-epimerase